MRPIQVVLLVFLALAFAPAVVNLAGAWTTVDYYSHGFLVPVVALWAAHRQRSTAGALALEPDSRGLLVLGAATAVYGLGVAIGEVSVQGVALVTAVAGVALWLLGQRWLRQLAFPVGYLLFMVPPPHSWLMPLISGLQLAVSDGAVTMLRAFGLSIMREGNVIILPGGESLFVAEACSGVTSLVTLLPIATLVSYFAIVDWWRRGLLILAVVPVAIVGNMFRVVVTVVLATRMGIEWATGSWFHDWVGTFVAITACLVLIGLGTLLGRWSEQQPPESF